MSIGMSIDYMESGFAKNRAKSKMYSEYYANRGLISSMQYESIAVNLPFQEKEYSLRDDIEKFRTGEMTLASICGLDSNELEEIYSCGYEAWHTGNIDSAMEIFACLVMQNPEDRRFHFAFACVLQQQGEYRQALIFFNYATAMQANDPWPFFYRAECLLALGETEAARDELDAVIMLCIGQSEQREYAKLRKKGEDLLMFLNK